jgi:hypothetical protein
LAARIEARRQVALAGRVAIAGTDTPVEGAAVSIVSGPPEFQARLDRLAAVYGTDWARLADRPDRARTAVDGYYWFLDLPVGSYTLSAAVPGAAGRYGTAGAAALVAADTAGTVTPGFADIALPPTSIAGRVVDAATLPAGLIRKDPALVARWRLDEPSGPALDDVGGRQAVPTGSMTRAVPGLVADEAGPAVLLTGGFFEVPFAVQLNPPQFSLEAWASVSGGAGTIRSVVVSRDNTVTADFRGYGLYASDSDRWELRLGDGTAFQALAGPVVVESVPVHLVATFDGSLARLYVDGALAATSAAIAFVANAARPLRLGAGATETAAQSFFPGVLDEVAVYDTALGAATITARHAAATSPSAATPVPMAAVRVQGSGEQTFTGADGRYVLRALEPGARNVVFSAVGYQPQTRSLELAEGVGSTLDVGLTAAP